MQAFSPALFCVIVGQVAKDYCTIFFENEIMNRKQAVNFAKKELGNFENPQLEAEWLVALTLGIKRGEVHSDKELSSKEERQLKRNLSKRKKSVPLEYIIGNAEFFGYTFKVNKNVLIPRPETEELVECVLKSVEKSSKVLDIGTGSGAIAISISKQTETSVVAVDVSRRALKIAKDNAKLNNADVRFIKSDLFSKLKDAKFDVIVSNPPYIGEAEYMGLDSSVKDFEPRLALVGGEDGLDFYRRIISEAKNHLNANGKIFFEIGYKQGEAVSNLLKEDFKDIVIKKDLEGNDRIVYATLK